LASILSKSPNDTTDEKMRYVGSDVPGDRTD
jgi:hypothetical protein